jgi:hypothetical protein
MVEDNSRVPVGYGEAAVIAAAIVDQWVVVAKVEQSIPEIDDFLPDGVHRTSCHDI